MARGQPAPCRSAGFLGTHHLQAGVLIREARLPRGGGRSWEEDAREEERTSV